MKTFRTLLAAALLPVLLPALPLRADEGMFMVNALDAALEKKMQERGLQLSAREIYNADAGGAALSDAVVSLDFGCTGSIISPEGLVITNHHCAYADLHALSSPQANLLENGFWAYKAADEIPVKDKCVQLLKKVVDVTDEARELLEQGIAGKGRMGSRKLAYTLEKRYERQTGLTARLASMWGGSKYYICLYQEYKDVRIVAAPPVCMAAFGGDVDNWQWPQQKCDFALYRIYAAPDGSPAEYAPENVPLGCRNPLKISTAGLKEGDFTMVIGYPGRTDRYSSSFKLRLQQETTLPLVNEVRGERMKCLKEAMNADPSVRLKYADKFFMLSNVQELYEMQTACVDRFGVIGKKERTEQRLQAWIEADSARNARWGTLLRTMDSSYRAAAAPKYRIAVFQETMVRATQISIFATRLSSSKGRCEPREWDLVDLPTERKLFDLALRTWYEKMDTAWMGPFQKELKDRYGDDYAAMAEALWSGSPLTDGRLAARPAAGADSLQRRADSLARAELIRTLSQDPLLRFFTDVKITQLHCQEAATKLNGLDRTYRQLLYRMYADEGVVQYPDANSTMRLSYGTTGPLAPPAGDIDKPWYTTPDQILRKDNPKDYDFALRKDVRKTLRKAVCSRKWNGWSEKGGMKVDFLTDNDITGGNSGSPVLNARGELVGLAFDGNAESLASDVDYTPEYNKCVCVDIRYVLWTLDAYGRLDRVIRELGLKP